MGFSLRPLGRAITDILGGAANVGSRVYDQVNPFDAGRSLTRRSPVVPTSRRYISEPRVPPWGPAYVRPPSEQQRIINAYRLGGISRQQAANLIEGSLANTSHIVAPKAPAPISIAAGVGRSGVNLATGIAAPVGTFFGAAVQQGIQRPAENLGRGIANITHGRAFSYNPRQTALQRGQLPFEPLLQGIDRNLGTNTSQIVNQTAMSPAWQQGLLAGTSIVAPAYKVLPTVAKAGMSGLGLYYGGQQVAQIPQTIRTARDPNVDTATKAEAIASGIAGTGLAALGVKGAYDTLKPIVKAATPSLKPVEAYYDKGAVGKNVNKGVGGNPFRKDSPAWKEYNKRYDFGNLYDAKSKEEFALRSKGLLFESSGDNVKLRDAIRGDKKVAFADNSAYDPIFSELAKRNGLYTEVHNGATFVGRNKTDVQAYIKGGKNLTKAQEYNLIGYKPERFTAQPKPPQVGKPKVTAKELGMGKALGMTKEQVIAAKYPRESRQAVTKRIGDQLGLDKETTRVLSQTGKKTKEPIQFGKPDQLPAVYDKKIFRDTTSKYLGQKEATKTLNTATARSLPKLKGNESLGLISAIEEGAGTGKFGGIPTQVRQILDAKHRQLTEAGVDIGYLQDYFPHRWQNEAKVAQEYQAIKLRSGIQNERALPTVAEGVRLGFKPLTTDYRQAIQAYLDTADRLLADRKYFNNLKKQGHIVESGTRPQGMVAVDAPGLPAPTPHFDPETGVTFQGAYYAKPETAAQLNRLFGEDIRGAGGKVLKKTATAASVAQDVGLAGGIPGTPLNAFGIAQNLRSIMGGSVRAPLKADVLAMSKRLTNRYWDKHAADLAELQSQGIPVRTNYSQQALKTFGERISSRVDQGAKTKATAALAETWNSAVNNPTFSRFMPIMQTEYFRHVRDNLVRAGVPREQAVKIAGERLINFEGIKSAGTQALRNKTTNDAVTTFLFAPKYRESMINFWANNVKALYPKNVVQALNPRNGAYRGNLMFDAAALGTFLYMDDLNQKHNDGRHLWDNPPGKQDKLLIQFGGKTIGIPFLSSIATVPRTGINIVKDVATGDSNQLGKDVAGFAGYGVRPILDTVVNEDYFGNKIRDPSTPLGEQAKQVAGYFGSQYQHPYVKAALRSQNKPGFQVASEALELPFRFYSTSGVNTALVQKDFGGDFKAAPQATKEAFQRWHPGANEFGDYEDQPDNPAYTRERAVALQDSGLFNLEKSYAIAQNKYKGKPIDPIFNLPVEQRKKALWKQTLLPGSTDPELSKLYSQDWYQDYNNARSKYYNEKKVYSLKQADTYEKQGNTELATKIRHTFSSQDNPYPETPKNLQRVMDQYSALPKGTGARSAWIRANPSLWQAMTSQWAAIDNWQNRERIKLGLAPTEGDVGIAGGYKEGFSSFGFGGGGSSKKTAGAPYKYAVSRTAAGESVKPKVTVKKGGTSTGKARVASKPVVKLTKSKV